MEYKEIFDTLKNWSKSYSLAHSYTQITKDENGKYKIDDEILNNIFQIMGCLDEDMVRQAFKDIKEDIEFQNTYEIGDEGMYTIEVLLSYDKGQMGEYSRWEIEPYVYVECIEFNRYADLISHTINNDEEDDIDYPF